MPEIETLGPRGGSQLLPELLNHLLGVATLIGTLVEDLDNESIIYNSLSVGKDICAYISSDDVLAPLAVWGISRNAFCA